MVHVGNELPSIPIAYSIVEKESYETMKKLLNLIKYDDHQWRLCCDLKVVGLCLGQQMGNTKFPCFICMWDSRNRIEHYGTLIFF